MEFYDAINNRSTVREWADADVSEEALKRILNAGLQAPSNDHLRDWEFIVLHSHEEKENALQFVKAWTKKQSETKNALLTGTSAQKMFAYAIPRQYSMLMDAPYVVIPTFRAGPAVFHAGSVDHLNPFASIWCVIENIFLSAAAEGLACSIRIPIGEEGRNVSMLLKIPPSYIIPCYVGIGHPALAAVKLEQHHYVVEQKMHKGHW